MVTIHPQFSCAIRNSKRNRPRNCGNCIISIDRNKIIILKKIEPEDE
ncbi:MAG TPA: hypothetical protein VLA48_04625 [Nitrososphaeraceae archaeon]|nr:hypothetical protein [Nitrososphaeraceae archaeon]